MTAGGGPQNWWDQAVGYEVYIRSFADASGDGVGDFVGLSDRLDHLQWLGVDIVWVTPFYPSPMHDFGYDIADYTGVDPLFGDLDDFDRTVAKTHELGLKIIIDVVPNHSSIDHPWFVDSRSGIESDRREWYLWRDPAPDGGPPNNWISNFGGSAWTLDEASGQYYLHSFLPQQPDLNWRNPAVVAAWEDIIRFWLDRGVDGFRIDVTQGLVKDADFRDNPQLRPLVEGMNRDEQWESFEHRHDIMQPESLEVYRGWNAICAEYEAVLIGETYVLDADALHHFLTPRNGIHTGFWFKPMYMEWEPAAVLASLQDPVEAVGDGIGWVISSHDDPRAPSRFGTDEPGHGAERALALFTMMAMLPGTPFLYMGDELGLDDGVVPPERFADPVSLRTGVDSDNRDGVRTPMPWHPDGGWGFTTSADPWLPFGGRTSADTVEVQRSTADSLIHRWRRLLAFRREILQRSGFNEATPEFFRDGDLIGFRRGDVTVQLNLGSAPLKLADSSASGTVLFRSMSDISPDVIRPDEAVVALQA